MSPGLHALICGVLFERTHHEATKLLIAAIADHVARADLSEQRVFGLEPERRLSGIAAEELRDQAADVGNFLETLQDFLRNLLANLATSRLSRSRKSTTLRAFKLWSAQKPR
jgi:hypothetical protein